MPKISKTGLLLIGVSLIISGCESSTKRDCPAFFHPDYDKWAQQSVGETLVFTDQNGITETFDVTEIIRNEAFQTEDFGSTENTITCTLTVSEVLVRRDSSETIFKNFSHGERSDKDLDNENFFLGIDFITGNEEERRRDFLIDLLQRLSLVEDEISVQSKHSELEIGGVLYQDVITKEVTNEQFLVSPDQVRSVAIANGFGLVQYTRVDGSVFSRMQ